MPELNSDNNMIKLQSILLPTDLCSEEQVYYHMSESGLVQDFDGYFNLFYIEKRKKYTSITKLFITLCLKGYSSITLMHDRDIINTIQIHNSNIKTESTYEFPYNKYDQGVFWFRLEKGAIITESFISGYYAGESLESRPVKVFVDICTYKREEYVVNNMRRLSELLDESENKNIHDNLLIALIDNGQTLDDCSELQKIIKNHPQISVIENRNTGGAGGFTRGMEEAITRKEKDRLTHVLLMDDDASFDTDLFIRLYGILGTLKHEYNDLTIGGALWRQDYPFIQYAAGEWYEQMEISNEIPSLDMCSYEECTCREMCTADNELRRYSGWWCCCYSLNIVTPNNLPMKQLFIHMDDIEYEKRNRLQGNPVAFFNGIGVWHKPFDAEFLGAKTYYNTRNSLILSSKLEPEVTSRQMRKKISRMLIGNCLDNRYLKMHLIYMGAMDFLKGRKWLENLDTEKHHQQLLKYVKEKQDEVLVTDINDPKIASVKNEIIRFQSGPIPLSEVRTIYTQKNVHLPRLKKLTLNGKLLPSRKDIAVVFPYDRLWKKGYRQGVYVFVQQEPNKVFYVKNCIKERLTLVTMCIRVCLKNGKKALEQYR